VERLDAMTASLAAPSSSTVTTFQTLAPEFTRRRTSEQHEAGVRHLIGEIQAGEAFQVVLSQRFEMPTEAEALNIYRVLRASNPSPYMYLFRVPDGHGGIAFDIVGSSPEALVTVVEGVATTHPIAGTRWRGETTEDDLLLEKDLRADAKENAEHLMLVDLGRNDLGRVCEPGTVTVTQYRHVERYSHVMHLVSTVQGRLAQEKTALDAVTACFPAGTLSGAPKPRAMELIEQLEPTRRGVYGGIVGYLDFAGDADTAIAIRTAVLKDGTAYVQAGGGVVADSDPAAEDTESVNKALAVLSAVASAETMRGVGDA
ncbi:MAG: chorismate-binding protein, partial [Mycobacteriaceae bacterium]